MGDTILDVDKAIFAFGHVIGVDAMEASLLHKLQGLEGLQGHRDAPGVLVLVDGPELLIGNHLGGQFHLAI